jgi:hypothetical protein
MSFVSRTPVLLLLRSLLFLRHRSSSFLQGPRDQKTRALRSAETHTEDLHLKVHLVSMLGGAPERVNDFLRISRKIFRRRAGPPAIDMRTYLHDSSI